MDLKIIENDLILFLENNIFDENVSINADSCLKDSGIDSFSIVEIILFIERKYSFIIPEEKLVPETFFSIHSLALLILEYLKVV